MEDARGRRLLADLNHAFRKDPFVDEYDFLPVLEPQHNASPLVLVEHKLGLELWSVRLLFRYAYSRLMAWRGRGRSSTFIDGSELFQLSRAVLLINPDCYTAWNIRKELIENGDLTMAEDLKLGRLILSKFPKSSETFIHRRWLFQRLVNQCLSNSSDSCASTDSQHDNNSALLCMDGIDIALGPEAGVVVNGSKVGPNDGGRANAAAPLESSRLLAENLHGELKVCERAADGYASNYYAWTHRAWVVRYCFNCSLRVVMSELESTQAWTMKHVSDHSGLHYRQFLLSTLSQHATRLHRQFSKSLSDIIDGEHDFICDLIHTCPDHQALWSHRRCVFHMMMMAAKSNMDETSNMSVVVNGESPSSRGAISKNEGQKRSRLENSSPAVRKRETELVQKVIEQTKDAYQKTLAQSYLQWLDKMFPSSQGT